MKRSRDWIWFAAVLALLVIGGGVTALALYGKAIGGFAGGK